MAANRRAAFFLSLHISHRYLTDNCFSDNRNRTNKNDFLCFDRADEDVTFLLNVTRMHLPRRGERSLLVRQQRRSGVLGRRSPRGFRRGAPGARPPRHPQQRRPLFARGPGRRAESRRTLSEQLGFVGVLIKGETKKKKHTCGLVVGSVVMETAVSRNGHFRHRTDFAKGPFRL